MVHHMRTVERSALFLTWEYTRQFNNFSDLNIHRLWNNFESGGGA